MRIFNNDINFHFTVVEPSEILKSNVKDIDEFSLQMIKFSLHITLPFTVHIINICLE